MPTPSRSGAGQQSPGLGWHHPYLALLEDGWTLATSFCFSLGGSLTPCNANMGHQTDRTQHRGPQERVQDPARQSLGTELTWGT